MDKRSFASKLAAQPAPMAAKKRDPAFWNLDRCPVTGLPITRRPEWTDQSFGFSNYRTTLGIIGKRILFAKDWGSVSYDSIAHFYALLKQVGESMEGGGKYITLEDFRAVESTQIKSVRRYSALHQSNDRLYGIVFCGLPPGIKFMARQAAKLAPNPNGIAIRFCSTYQEAVLEAALLEQRLLSQEDQRTDGFSVGDFSAKFRLLEPGLLWAEWAGELGQGNITGVFKKFEQIYYDYGCDQVSTTLIVDVTGFTGGIWRENRTIIALAKALYKKMKITRVVAYGGSPTVLGLLAIVRSQMPFALVLASDYSDALTKAQRGSHKSEQGAPLLPLGRQGYLDWMRRRDTRLVRPHLDRLLAYLGELDWNRRGFPQREVIKNDPFDPVFDALDLIKMDFDSILSERKRLLEGLRLSKAQADKLNEAQSRFLAQMTHDIRTPLHGILSMSRLLRENTQTLGEDARESLDIIYASTENLRAIMDDILDFSKIETGVLRLESKDFGVRSLAQDMARMFGARAREKGVNFAVDVDDSLPEVLHGDPARLRQIFMNLTSNAVKFTMEGQVTLHLSGQESPDGVLLQVEVSDTGIGIPPERIPYLFKRFTQVDASTTRKFGGTGLGLSIVKQLLELMGGRVSVVSTEGVGTRFSITIPLARGEQGAIQEPQWEGASQKEARFKPLSEVPAGEGLQFLVAEDNPVNQRVLQRVLEKLGHTGVCVNNGAEAVALFEQKRWDGILMDIQMPVMDGYEATQKIRQLEIESGSHIPIIAITASSVGGVKEQSQRAGMDGFLMKPLNLEAFQNLLKEISGS